jgi:hypothetical protein
MYPIIEIAGTEYFADYDRKVYFRGKGETGYTPVPEGRMPGRVAEKLANIETETIERFFWRGNI